MTSRCVEHVAARGPAEVGVVEDDSPLAGVEPALEFLGELAQRAAALVAVEADVAARGVLAGDARLAGARDAHDQHDLPLGRGERVGCRERDGGRVPGTARRAARAAERARLGAPGARDRDDSGRDVEQPGQRRLGRGGRRGVGGLGKIGAAAESAGAARSAQRRVRDQRDPELLAALDHAAAQRAIIVHAQRHLDGGDRGEGERFVELVAVDVGNPDPRHQALVEQARERADGGAPRRPVVGRVDQVQVDREAVERGQARLAVAQDRLRATVRDPGAARAGHAALGDDPPTGARGRQRPRQQPLVVAELRLAAAVRVRGVEHGDPGLRARRRSSRRRARRRGRPRSTCACSPGRCGAPRRRARQDGSGARAYATRSEANRAELVYAAHR